VAASIRARHLIDALLPGLQSHIQHVPYSYAMLARPELKESLASRTAEANWVILSASYGLLPHFVVEWLERVVREARHEVRIMIALDDPPVHATVEACEVEEALAQMAQRCHLCFQRLNEGMALD